MSDEPEVDDLANAAQGDLQAFSRLALRSHETIERCAAKLPPLVVDAGAVRKVLQALRDGAAPPDLVQSWASFVRRGHMEGLTGPLFPVDIDYPPDAEDQLVEIISRLDELGDLIDGEVSDSEIESMLEGLQGY